MNDKRTLLHVVGRVATLTPLCLLAGYVATYVTLRNQSVRDFVGRKLFDGPDPVICFLFELS